jgi:hypothetical protein
MNRPNPSAPPLKLFLQPTGLVLTGIALLTGMLAITGQSFWIDESSTATIASQPTLANWWSYLFTSVCSDTQMPLYMLYIWGWQKLFGCSEWILRASNLPWLLLGFLALPRRSAGVVLALAVSPFLWFYLNEARPYVMQISLSLLLAGAMTRFLASPDEVPDGADKREWIWWAAFCFGTVMLAGSSLLGMIWAGAAVMAWLLILGRRHSWRLIRAGWWFCSLSVLLLGGLAGYYLWTIHRGNAATPGSTGIKNVLFVVYEVCGFAGLGPGRGDIHGAGLTAFRWSFILPLMLYGLVLAAVFFVGVRLVLRDVPARIKLGLAVALGGAAAFLLVAGVTRHFTVLGRHFAPLSVGFLLLLGMGLQRLLASGGWRRMLAVALVLLSLASALSLRFASRHLKDDYRTAAGVALAAYARGERVWWCADGTAGLYYAVPLSPPKSPSAAPAQVWLISNPPAVWLTNNPAPAWVLLSKPELHDPHGVVQDFLKHNRFQCLQSFSAFTVWIPPKH